jgi:Uma2 family endonuclease
MAAEVWIVNRRAEAVEVYRAPSSRGYQQREVVGRGGQAAPQRSRTASPSTTSRLTAEVA